MEWGGDWLGWMGSVVMEVVKCCFVLIVVGVWDFLWFVVYVGIFWIVLVGVVEFGIVEVRIELWG